MDDLIGAYFLAGNLHRKSKVIEKTRRYRSVNESYQCRHITPMLDDDDLYEPIVHHKTTSITDYQICYYRGIPLTYKDKYVFIDSTKDPSKIKTLNKIIYKNEQRRFRI